VGNHSKASSDVAKVWHEGRHFDGVDTSHAIGYLGSAHIGIQD
jgi:hypothetical protein